MWWVGGSRADPWPRARVQSFAMSKEAVASAEAATALEVAAAAEGDADVEGARVPVVAEPAEGALMIEQVN